MTETNEFVPIRCLSHEEFFSVMRGFSDPQPEPSGPVVTSKKQLLTPQDKAHYISQHGGAAYLKLPKE